MGPWKLIFSLIYTYNRRSHHFWPLTRLEPTSTGPVRSAPLRPLPYWTKPGSVPLFCDRLRLVRAPNIELTSLENPVFLPSPLFNPTLPVQDTRGEPGSVECMADFPPGSDRLLNKDRPGFLSPSALPIFCTFGSAKTVGADNFLVEMRVERWEKELKFRL